MKDSLLILIIVWIGCIAGMFASLQISAMHGNVATATPFVAVHLLLLVSVTAWGVKMMREDNANG